MANPDPASRRNFVRVTAVTAAGLFVGGCAAASGGQEGRKGEAHDEEQEVSPAEDLMREHGVLKRILLVYGEAVRRIDANQDLPPGPVLDAAKLVRTFVEDYHEKLEEDFLFPRFRKANQLVDLVDVLQRQHEGGRRVTDVTLRFANLSSLRDDAGRKQLRESMAQFIRMYNPHEAREDTVLFPAFRKIVSKHEYDALGEDFENKEHELFGDDGFEKMVDRVANIERTLGIYDLAQFTPTA
jgi:hemerythrin-like domain-containing protein